MKINFQTRKLINTDKDLSAKDKILERIKFTLFENPSWLYNCVEIELLTDTHNSKIHMINPKAQTYSSTA